MREHIFKSIFCAVIVFAALWVGWMMADNKPPYVWDETESFISPDPIIDGGRA